MDVFSVVRRVSFSLNRPDVIFRHLRSRSGPNPVTISAKVASIIGSGVPRHITFRRRMHRLLDT